MSNKDRHELSRSRLIDFEKLVAREAAAGKEEGGIIQIAPGSELGDQVIEFHEASKQLGENALFNDLTFTVPKGAILGVVGPNGTGKTTLIRMLVGEVEPDAGEIVVGTTVKFAYVPQETGMPEPDKSLLDEIGDGASEITLGKRLVPVRQYMARFGFKGPDQQKRVGELSGGERNRCLLAKVLKIGGNVLLLDEPTNDLDVNTLRMLEEAIEDFAGCALVVSHDRFFLDRISTHLLVFEGEGAVRWFTGNFREYEAWRMKEMGSRLFENRRNRYRKIVH